MFDDAFGTITPGVRRSLKKNHDGSLSRAQRSLRLRCSHFRLGLVKTIRRPDRTRHRLRFRLMKSRFRPSRKTNANVADKLVTKVARGKIRPSRIGHERIGSRNVRSAARNCGPPAKHANGSAKTFQKILDLNAELEINFECKNETAFSRRDQNKKPVVTKDIIHRDYCPCCQKRVTPKLPDVLPGCMLGNRTLVFSALLHFLQGLTPGATGESEAFGCHWQSPMVSGMLVWIGRISLGWLVLA